jgi:hypothetical protein
MEVTEEMEEEMADEIELEEHEEQIQVSLLMCRQL